ncbi:testis-expressed protein 264 homolog [Lampris incognitus]|uniref:testis-expressed protein 264 homolog n=1 Tax=Lampris incognitus TaxID=2546036 RepID=UPI0024B5FFB1|nr:testis-expressed protein 264 homolog [Lampris incognitus]
MPEWGWLCVIVNLVCCVFATVAVFMLYSGLISQINIRCGSPPIKSITFAYKFKEGPYKNCGQLFTECYSIGPKLSYIGVFYDDHKEVRGQRCRYVVGTILSEGGMKPSEELLQRCEESGFRVYSFPEVTHVVTTSFPHRTLLSILLGVRRVYPRLEHYIKERKLCAHPFLEIYRGGQIQFMVPLARQADFYVPEVCRVDRRQSVGERSDSDTEISGAESNSEYSSGSGILLSDSRETSPSSSATHTEPCNLLGDGDRRGRSSTPSSARVLNQELHDGQQMKGDVPGHASPDKESLVVAAGIRGVVVGGEE